jgi:hypothetical protein
LKGWGSSLKGHARKYRMTLKEELDEIEKLEEETILPTTLLDRKTCIQAELLKIMEEEELYWHKRSNENWLLKGDNDTAYFHRKANGKKRKNTIFHLENEVESIDREEDIIKHATEYYKTLFGPSESPIFSLDPDCWAPNEKITEEENTQLIKPFSEDEIKKVIKSMKKHSTRA